MRILLISGGSINIEWAADFLKINNYDKIIAVDGGLSAANLLQLVPDVIVGDFDTVSSELLEMYSKDKQCRTVRLNPVKDDTDTQCAMNIAIEMGAEEIDIIGGTGGRIDHGLANIFMLKMALEKGVRAVMYDEVNKVYVIKGHKKLKRDPLYGRYISFMQLEGPALNVTMKGFLYNVEHFDFDTSKEYRLGVSNEFKDEEAEINIGHGMFIVTEISEK